DDEADGGVGHDRRPVRRSQATISSGLRLLHMAKSEALHLCLPHPEEPREARRLEGSAARASCSTVAAPWFETRRCATPLTMRRGEVVKQSGALWPRNSKTSRCPDRSRRAAAKSRATEGRAWRRATRAAARRTSPRARRP